MTSTAVKDTGSVQLGLNLQLHPQLAKIVRRYINWRETILSTDVLLSSRLVDDYAGVRALVEISTVLPTQSAPFMLLEIEFWDDALITVRDHIFLEPTEHGLSQPLAAIPVTSNISFGDVPSLIDWIDGLIISKSLHRFVAAETLLNELRDQPGSPGQS